MMKKTYIWRSTYAQPCKDYFKSQLNETDYAVLSIMYLGYNVPRMLDSSYFQYFRAGDGKYTLILQKYVNDTYSVKYTINKNYANQLERFS